MRSFFTVGFKKIRAISLFCAVLLNVGLAAPAAFAEDAAAAMAVSPAGGGMEQVLKTILGLVVVLAVILALGWAVKRYGNFNSSAMGQVKLLAGLSLGNRERVVVVDIGGKQLVLGVTPSSISALAELKESERITIPSSGASEVGTEFSKRLKQAISGRAGV